MRTIGLVLLTVLLSACGTKEAIVRTVKAPPEIRYEKVPMPVPVTVDAKYLVRCDWIKSAPQSDYMIVRKRDKICLLQYEDQLDAIKKHYGSK